MEKVLYIVRGIPGSGKSTFAKSLGGTHFEADMFFMKNGEYKYDMFKNKEWINSCWRITRSSQAVFDKTCYRCWWR